jgi:hypothetical protein
MNFFKEEKLTAFEAKEAAQWIAFGPVIFQVARVLRKLGILKEIENGGVTGVSLDEISINLKLPRYGVKVLLESALSMGLILVNDKKYSLAKTGYFILNDPLTSINMNFVHDVCYKGLFELDNSIENSKPEGLKNFGEWETIYEGLSKLPEDVQTSWYDFDHFFSNNAFPFVLPLVYKNNITNLLDIGGNTGIWAIASAKYNPDVAITILDLPEQLVIAKEKVEKEGLSNRISFLPGNILNDEVKLLSTFDAIWMSQFLDCFNEKDIVSILKKCYNAIDENGMVFILEPFWDKQKFEVSSFCLQQTSIYFTALANGSSQIYNSENFYNCIDIAGLEIVEEFNDIGLCQTLLHCKKKSTLKV